MHVCALLYTLGYLSQLQVVSNDLYTLTRRYNTLHGRVGRRGRRLEEAREKRLSFDEAMEVFLLKLGEAEVMVGEMRDAGVGKNSSRGLREQLEGLEVCAY